MTCLATSYEISCHTCSDLPTLSRRPSIRRRTNSTRSHRTGGFFFGRESPTSNDMYQFWISSERTTDRTVVRSPALSTATALIRLRHRATLTSDAQFQGRPQN